jgi:hypothetical protein
MPRAAANILRYYMIIYILLIKSGLALKPNLPRYWIFFSLLLYIALNSVARKEYFKLTLSGVSTTQEDVCFTKAELKPLRS